ncbi:MAG: GAF domain-containing sensor histidine kinase [Dehalococcoidia bacterium]
MDEVQTEHSRLLALVEASRALTSELNLDRLLQRIADVSREVVGASYAAVGVLDDKGDLGQFVFSGLDEETAARIGHRPTGVGVLGAIIEENRPLRLREIADHPRSSGFPDHHPPMHSFLGVPISGRSGAFGRLYLTEKQGDAEFTAEDERIALMLAGQASVAVENARLYEEVSQRNKELERLQDALKHLAVFEERDRIARELHDGVVQSIYSVGLSLQGSLSLLSRDPAGTRARIDEAINELDNVVRDVRSYIFELRPKIVEEKGLAAAIEELAKEFEVNTLAHVDLDIAAGDSEQLGAAAQGHVIQIVREVLSNIARHAGAMEVTVRLAAGNGEVLLLIDDDGHGFDPSTVSRGHGLNNMSDRARKLNGQLLIETREGGGTRHSLRFRTEATGD